MEEIKKNKTELWERCSFSENLKDRDIMKYMWFNMEKFYHEQNRRQPTGLGGNICKQWDQQWTKFQDIQRAHTA